MDERGYSVSNDVPYQPSEENPYESWVLRLEAYCKRAKLQPIVYEILSDRRGGRTAWSATVTISGKPFAARFWYDGKHLNNAKEDAAKVALHAMEELDWSNEYIDSQTLFGKHDPPSSKPFTISRCSGTNLKEFQSKLQGISRNQQEVGSGHEYNLLLHIRWELPQAMKRYRPGSTVASLFTITGDQVHAQAASCGEYLQEHFPLAASVLLRQVQQALDGNCEAPDSQDSKDSGLNLPNEVATISITESDVFLNASADLKTVVELAAALAWLSLAIRPFTGKGVQMSSDLQFKFDHYNNTNSIHAEARLCPLRKPRDQACWHDLFANIIVVQDGPIRSRAQLVASQKVHSPGLGHPRGLEMPFSLMLELSAAHYPFEYEGGLIISGISTLLVATGNFHDSSSSSTKGVQWHLTESDGDDPILEYMSHSPIQWDRGSRPGIEEVSCNNTRTFLGWCQTAHIALGRTSPAVDIDFSKLERAGKRPRLKSFNLGFSGGQFFNVTGARTYEFQEDTVKRDARLSALPEMIEKAHRMPVILYDAVEKRGWLVPKLLVIFAMTSIYLREFGYTPSPPVAGKSFSETKDSILRHSNEKFIPKGSLSEKARELHEISFMQLLLDFYHEITVAQNYSMWTRSRMDRLLGRRTVFGVDFLELARKGNEYDEYGIYKSHLEDGHGDWISLIDEKMLPGVMFCRGLGDVIQCMPDNAMFCDHCRTVPSGLSYLGADIASLDRVLSRTQHFCWSSPHNDEAFRPCDDCASFDHRLHKISKIQPSGETTKHSALTPTLQKGAVVIGYPRKQKQKETPQPSKTKDYLPGVNHPLVAAPLGDTSASPLSTLQCNISRPQLESWRNLSAADRPDVKGKQKMMYD